MKVNKVYTVCFLLVMLFPALNRADGRLGNQTTLNSNSVKYSPIVVNKVNYMIPLDRSIITTMIDSLLELEIIPFDLVEALHLKIDELRSPAKQYVTDKVYEHWDTDKANPYKEEYASISKDSTLQLFLDDYVHPIKGVVTSRYGFREGKMHKGIDVDLEVWDTLRAAFSGKVRLAKYYGGYGRAIIIRHDNGLETIYAHLHRFKVQTGDRVQAGDLIGLGGSSGHSTGSHLHFETRFLGQPLNPETFIDFKTGTLTTNEIVVKRKKYGFACFPKGAEFYTVKKGDYLHKICDEYGISIKKICELNHMSRNKMLKVGQQLRVI